MGLLNQIRKHKKVFTIGVVLTVVTLVLLGINFRKPTVVTPQPSPGFFDPQFSPKPIQQVLESEIFEVLSVYPGEGEVQIIIPNEALGFRFSRPIDSDSVVFTITPNIGFTTSYDEENSVYYVHPSQFWNKKTTYNTSINAVSQQGEELKSPFETTFSPKEVSNTTGIGDEHSGGINP